MGPITHKLTLTNATDEAMVRRGEIAQSDVRRLTVVALVNADVVRSVVSKKIAEVLGLEIRDGIVRSPILFECFGGQTIDDAEVGSDGVVIGRTVITKIQNPGRIKPQFGPIKPWGIQ